MLKAFQTIFGESLFPSAPVPAHKDTAIGTIGKILITFILIFKRDIIT